jgi:uncharacterized protein (DUF488 family)
MKERPGEQKIVVYTIGHSTRPVSEFTEVIKAYGIRTVVDIRTIPKSRHNPQFNEDMLKESLRAVSIRYLHATGLGGLRHASKESPNRAWRNASFRGFADYMQTVEFEEALEKLIDMAEKQTTTVMCAEAVPWRCHRSLIGDALLIRGVSVIHIMGMNSAREHTLTPWAKVEGKKITYPQTV